MRALQLRKLQDKRNDLKKEKKDLSSRQMDTYQEFSSELKNSMKQLSLNPNRIEALLDHLYDINKRLVDLEISLWKMANSSGIDRKDFLKEYHGNELDPTWINRVVRLKRDGWQKFVKENIFYNKILRKKLTGYFPSYLYLKLYFSSELKKVIKASFLIFFNTQHILTVQTRPQE